MTDDRREQDERNLQRAARVLRAPGARDADAMRDVIDVLRSDAADGETAHSSARTVMPARLGRRVRLRRRPLVSRGTIRFDAGLAAGVAFAAGLGLGIFAGWRMRGESVRLANEPAVGRALPTVVEPAGLARPVQFMLVAPAATRVSLVGEFNDWDPTATPMAREAGGAWHVALPLASGRHVYAFVVDGRSWVADPQAPLAAEGWYGARNSVLLVTAERTQ